MLSKHCYKNFINWKIYKLEKGDGIMYSKTTKIKNSSGVHARPASFLVNEAKNFKSNITIRQLDSDSEPQNAKSIISLLAMALPTDAEIEIAAEGEDDVEAVDKLISLVESGLGE